MVSVNPLTPTVAIFLQL